VGRISRNAYKSISACQAENLREYLRIGVE
jgi:hypothetical protein